MGQQGQERRRFLRAEIPCRIIVDSTSKLFATKTMNVSEGGIRVILKARVESLSLVNLELMLENSLKINCKARTAWVLEKPDPEDKDLMIYDTGLQFIELSDKDRESIRDLVRRLALKSSE